MRISVCPRRIIPTIDAALPAISWVGPKGLSDGTRPSEFRSAQPKTERAAGCRLYQTLSLTDGRGPEFCQARPTTIHPSFNTHHGAPSRVAGRARELARLFEAWRRAFDAQVYDAMRTARRAINAVAANGTPRNDGETAERHQIRVRPRRGVPKRQNGVSRAVPSRTDVSFLYFAVSPSKTIGPNSSNQTLSMFLRRRSGTASINFVTSRTSEYWPT